MSSPYFSKNELRILVSIRYWNLKMFLKDRIGIVCYNVKYRDNPLAGRVCNAEQVN